MKRILRFILSLQPTSQDVEASKHSLGAFFYVIWKMAAFATVITLLIFITSVLIVGFWGPDVFYINK